MTVIRLLYLVACSLPISGNLLLYKTLNGLFKTWKVCVILFKTWQLESSAIWVDSVHLLALGEDQKRNNGFKVLFTHCVLSERSYSEFYWLSLLPTSEWLFSFFIYCVELSYQSFFFFFNLTLIYFSSSLRLKRWKERNYSVGPNNLFETLTAERLK